MSDVTHILCHVFVKYCTNITHMQHTFVMLQSGQQRAVNTNTDVLFMMCQIERIVLYKKVLLHNRSQCK